MGAEEIHEGDIGTVFQFTFKDNGTAIDISTLTTREIIFKKPDKTKLVKTPSLVTDGTDGLVTYTIASGDINQIGMWSAQGRLALSNTQNWYSDVVQFKVFPNI